MFWYLSAGEVVRQPLETNFDTLGAAARTRGGNNTGRESLAGNTALVWMQYFPGDEIS